MKNFIKCLTLVLALMLASGLALTAIPAVFAAEDTVYLGDRQDLFISRDSLDEFGWNTAHSGEPIKIGSKTFDKGLGFHCQPDRDAYVEFDISSLNLKYFAAEVGVLKEASYFLEWGSISFHVYGDGELLASSPVKAWNEDPYFLTCSVEGVKTLKLVQNNDGNYACDAGVWGNARLTVTQPKSPDTETDAEGETTVNPDKTNLPQPADRVSGDYAYVSDLYWMDTKTYTGNVVGRDCNTANEIIFSNDGKFFPKGVGFHATSADFTSYLDMNIEGLGFTKFAAYYGVCETLSGHDITMAAVKFAVYGDGVKLWESSVIRFAEDMLPMECDITGVKVLRLAVAGGPGISGAWGTFGGAVISKSGNITDAMLFTDPSETETPTEDPTEPVTEPVTEAPTETPNEALTEPVTETPTEEVTLPVTETPTEAPTNAPEDTSADDQEESRPAGSGCGASMALGALTTAAAAAIALKKKEN